MQFVLGPLAVLVIAVAAGPIIMYQALWAVGVVELLLGLLAGALFVSAAVGSNVIKSNGGRYFCGAVVTTAVTYLAYITIHPALAGRTGEWAWWTELIAFGISFWNGFLIGGPLQLIIKTVQAAREREASQPPPVIELGTSFHQRMLKMRDR